MTCSCPPHFPLQSPVFSSVSVGDRLIPCTALHLVTHPSQAPSSTRGRPPQTLVTHTALERSPSSRPTGPSSSVTSKRDHEKLEGLGETDKGLGRTDDTRQDQQTRGAYEKSYGLAGTTPPAHSGSVGSPHPHPHNSSLAQLHSSGWARPSICLLYTSDAADEDSPV